MLPKLTFVLGGAASGKSAWAENLLLSSGLEPVYVATSRIFDDEIKKKVSIHRSRRNDDWSTLEADIDLSDALSGLIAGQVALVDCATMWLTNHMLDGKDLGEATNQLLAAIDTCDAPVVVVSNEVGQGIVPDNALARSFREAQGRLNIKLAHKANLAVEIKAGLPMVLKGKLV